MSFRKHATHLTIAVAMPLFAAGMAAAETRLALVIGEDAYTEAPLTTAANDAGLVADTLREAGFEVTGQRNLDQPAMRNALKEFLGKVSQAGPDTVVAFYFSGYGLQYAGENYLVPFGAKIDRDTDVPLEAVRLDDFSRSLAAMQTKAKIMMIDAARNAPYAKSGTPLAGGLAMMDAMDGTLISFNTAPGSVIPDDAEGAQYGIYAKSFSEMARDPSGGKLEDVFAKLRVRANSLSAGAIVPWHVSKVTAEFTFFAPEGRAIVVEGSNQAQAPADAAATPAPPVPKPPIGPNEPLNAGLTAADAYAIVIERDTIKDYEAFLTFWGDDPLAKRVRTLLAARREAVTWRQSRDKDTAGAYWSYLKRYPKGPHAADARRRLAWLSASYEPPPVWEEIVYIDCPPPPPVEIIYVERPVFVFYDPIYAPLPPPPVWVVTEPVWYAPPPPPEPYFETMALPMIMAATGAGALTFKPPQFVKLPVSPAILQPKPVGQTIMPVLTSLGGKNFFQAAKVPPGGVPPIKIGQPAATPTPIKIGQPGAAPAANGAIIGPIKVGPAPAGSGGVVTPIKIGAGTPAPDAKCADPATAAGTPGCATQPPKNGGVVGPITTLPGKNGRPAPIVVGDPLKGPTNGRPGPISVDPIKLPDTKRPGPIMIDPVKVPNTGRPAPIKIDPVPVHVGPVKDPRCADPAFAKSASQCGALPPKLGRPDPIHVVPDTGRPAPIKVFPNNGRPEPIKVFPNAGRPEPIKVFPNAGRPEPVQVFPNAGRPEPVKVFPSASRPAPVVMQPQIQQVRPAIVAKPVEAAPAGRPAPVQIHKVPTCGLPGLPPCPKPQ